MATIITKRGSGVPTAGDLVEGEQAIDLTTGRVYTLSGGTVIECGTDPHDVNFISDVNAPTPNDGDVLVYDGSSGFWIAATASGGSTAIDRPYIVDPVNLSTGVGTGVDFTSSVFHSNVGGAHSSSDWEIYSNSALTTLVYTRTGATGTARTLLTTATGMSGSTTYYVRVRYLDNLGNTSNWSPALRFTT